METLIILLSIACFIFMFISLKLANVIKNDFVIKHQQNNELDKLEFVKETKEIDHSFAFRVADEIIRLQLNLSKMDESVKGYKQIKASVRKLEQSLNSNHYELEELLNLPYDNGMNLQASFVEDENLNENESIISRIIKPQINYKGRLVQAAQVEVSPVFITKEPISW